MKAVCFSLVLLLLAVKSGEGLRCNQCVGLFCSPTQMTCRSSADVCARIPYQSGLTIRNCMSRFQCESFRRVRINTYCCSTNLCN